MAHELVDKDLPFYLVGKDMYQFSMEDIPKVSDGFLQMLEIVFIVFIAVCK